MCSRGTWQGMRWVSRSDEQNRHDRRAVPGESFDMACTARDLSLSLIRFDAARIALHRSVFAGAFRYHIRLNDTCVPENRRATFFYSICARCHITDGSLSAKVRVTIVKFTFAWGCPCGRQWPLSLVSSIGRRVTDVSTTAVDLRRRSASIPDAQAAEPESAACAYTKAPAKRGPLLFWGRQSQPLKNRRPRESLEEWRGLQSNWWDRTRFKTGSGIRRSGRPANQAASRS